ncbi:hypothetical protein [Streptomyces apocyni]|uniref:hypothetical protein n=1 Tax=Streptomyces apocyni TaxID=2654677 RepID=UPI0012EA51A7|nr:hypothetical protein [Streptomyces apocyni]
MSKIAGWNREFQVWQYSVSHSVLLLRSVDPQLYDTRIDILFPAVEILHLRPTYEGLTIHQLNHDDGVDFLDNQGVTPSRGSVFLLNDGEGYVQAAKCEWFEDQGNHRAPSRFGPLRGTA